MTRMTSDYVRHVGLAHKLLLAVDKAGFSASDINELAESPKLLKQLLSVKREDATVTPIERVIDCDKAPIMFRGTSESFYQDTGEVARHDGHGVLSWKKLKLRILDPDEENVPS